MRPADISFFCIAASTNKEEQIAIAKIIFNMDNKIKVLESKPIKSRKIKEGMMSDWLTSKMRLVEVNKTNLKYEDDQPDLQMVAEHE